MNREIEHFNEQWKKASYIGAGFLASRIVKANTGNTIEEHIEAEIYYDGNESLIQQDKTKKVVASAVFGGLVGAITGYLANGRDGIIEGSWGSN